MRRRRIISPGEFLGAGATPEGADGYGMGIGQGLRVASRAVWTPDKDFGPTGIWLDGKEGIALTGGAVSSWTPKKAVGGLAAVTMNQGTAGNRPAQVADGVQFDGSNDFLQATGLASLWNFLHNKAGAYPVWSATVVFTLHTLKAVSPCLYSGAPGARFYTDSNGAGFMSVWDATGPIAALNPASITNGTFVVGTRKILTLVANGVTLAAWVNGAPKGSANFAGAVSIADAANTLCIGAYPDAAFPGHQTIHDVWISDVDITATRAKHDAYLASEYGVAL